MLTPLQADNTIRWIEALLSDNYRQCFGQLTMACRYPFVKHDGKIKTIVYDRKHCALGVALEEFGFYRFGNHYFFGFDADSAADLFSDVAVPEKWFHKTFGDDFESFKISHMNENGQSFAEIACYLSHFLPDSRRKAELQKLIMEKLEAQEVYLLEPEAVVVNKLKLPPGMKAKSLRTDLDRQVGKEA